MNASCSPSEPARPLRNTYWIVPGKLLAGEHPGGNSRDVTRERLQSLLDAGIRCFLDLTHPAELEDYAAELPVPVEYLRKPIRDHGIPTPLQMREILDCLHQALRSGPVYLHCRAGIGRTGTVAGCWLIEQGRGAAEALEELNLRWESCERSSHWTHVPETDEQVEFVRNWRAGSSNPGQPGIDSAAAAEPDDRLADPDALAAARGLRDRFLGSLLGLAVGDALAAATQFRRPGTFTPIGDLLGGGPFDLPRGGWSDDTAMALCLAESLLASHGVDAHHQIECYRRWQREGWLSATGQCVGITANTARALALAQWRRQSFSGSHDPTHLDPEPLSRVAPVVMFFFGFKEQAVHNAAEAARTTCQAPAVLEACRSLARALHDALAGRPKSTLLEHVRDQPSRHGNRTAAAALRTAVEAFGGTGSFRDAVLEAANGGGNSDVVTAVCGALAGAHYGVGAIPAAWRSSLLQQPLIESYADRLLAQALVDLA